MKIVKQLRAELKANNTRNKRWGRLLRSSGAFQVKITIYACKKFYVIKMPKETRTGKDPERGHYILIIQAPYVTSMLYRDKKHASMSPVRAQASLLPRYININRDLQIRGRGRLRGGDLFDLKFSPCISLLDCEQSLFFFRFSEGSERARACLSRLAPSVTRVVIFVSRAFCSKD